MMANLVEYFFFISINTFRIRLTLKTLIKNNLIFLINQLFELYILRCLNIYIIYFIFILIMLY